MTMRALRIGITLGLRHENESMWVNGIKQNALYLATALRSLPQVSRVALVNMTQVSAKGALGWGDNQWGVSSFEDVKDELDVMIELGGQINPEQTDYLKQRGTYLVSYCCGSEYVTTMESILFRQPSFGAGVFINQRYDHVWMIPQVAGNSRYYFEVLRRSPSTVVPFLWDFGLLEERAGVHPQGGVYQPRQHAARVSVLEPNINVVKFCLYPVLLAEAAYRHDASRIGFVHVCNAEALVHQSQEFVGLMKHLDLVQDGKISFVGRFDTPDFLARNTDVVVSHQWGNPLNYLYLEAAWLGYPLVHNADLCSDLGYFYPGNDVRLGAEQLIKAIDEHDREYETYRNRQRKIIHRYNPSNAHVQTQYADLLNQLLSNPPR